MKPSVWADIPVKVVREDADKIATHEVRNGRLFEVKEEKGGTTSSEGSRESA